MLLPKHSHEEAIAEARRRLPLSPVMAQRSVEKVAAPATRKQAGAVKVEADHRSAGVPSTTSPAGPSPQDRPQEDRARGAVVEVMTRLTAGESEPTGAPDGDPGGTQAEENEVEGTSNQFASDQAEPGEDDEAVEAKREFWSKLPQESYLKMIRRGLSSPPPSGAYPGRPPDPATARRPGAVRAAGAAPP